MLSRSSDMDLFVTPSTQVDQVPFLVSTELAANPNVVNL
jgi:hypothetical protein